MIQTLNNLETITLFVEDLARSRTFYSHNFAGDVVYEDEVSWVLKFGPLMINLLQSSEAAELVDPTPVGERGLGVRLLLTIRVEDANAVCGELKAQGVEILNGPVDRPWGRRTAAFSDPDGNVWEIAQEI